MSLLDNGDPEEFLLFVSNFNMTLKVSGMLETSTKVQYLHIIVRGEALCQFEMMSDDVESTNPLTVEAIILELGAYSPPVNSLSNQERVMRRGMSNQCVLKVRQY